MTVEELNIVISANDRKFNEALDEIIGRLDGLEEQSQRTGDTMENVFAKIKAAAATLGIGKIISDSIMAGGELEQNLGGVETVFRERADSMKKAAATAFEDMGLSESDYLANANKMGALLKGSGFDTGYASSVSQRVMQRASDVASIMGIDVKDAMEAVTGAAKGNFTMMDNLGVAMNDTTLQAYAQEKGLGTLETTQQKVNAAMQMFLDKTEYAAGNYARENDTFSGSLTTAKAQLENMTADLGTQLLPTATTLVTMARDGLEVISPLVVSLGEGLNSAAQYLINMSPSAKTMLAISLGMAVAIPAVTKAEAIWKAVNAGWSKVLDVLIPKEMTRANVLKATAGWLGIVAGLLAIVASVGSTAREMEESWGKSMEDTSGSADNAADSVDKVSDSYAGLNDNAKAAKKSLADIDTLNVFGSSDSTGGIDFGATVDGAESAQDSIAGLTDGIDEASLGLDELTNGFSLENIGDTFKQTFSDIGTGFGILFDSFNFDSDTQLSSLRVLDQKVRELFGDRWSDFWTGVGSTMYRAFGENNSEYDRFMALTDIQNWLQQIEDKFENDPGIVGAVAKWWNNLWEEVGSWLNHMSKYIGNSPLDFFNKWISGEISAATITGDYREESGAYNDLYQNMNERLAEYLKQGLDEDSAIEKVKSDFLKDDADRYYFEKKGYDESFGYLYAHDLKQLLEESGQLEYPDYSIPESALASVIPGASGGVSGAMKPLSAAETKQSFEIHAHLNVDGREVAESVTSYQNGENSRSNGY